MAKPSKLININKIRELIKRKQKLEREWHNRSRAQRQAWGWRRKVAEMARQKYAKDKSQHARIPKQQSELPALDKKICLRCVVHCPVAGNIRWHWMNRLYMFLSTLVAQLDESREPEESGIGLVRQVLKAEQISGRFWEVARLPKTEWWLPFKGGALFQKIRNICKKFRGWVIQVIRRKWVSGLM
jgi:hypothetical protein